MRNRGVIGFALLATVAVSGQALAMENVTVSATRRSANLQEVPLAVTAVTTDEIEKLQIVSADDIGAIVPNLQTYPVTAGAQAMQLHARGASVQNPGFNVSESPVGIYEDDVYRGRLASANLDLTDVERIEVLRGPQATLYGRNTIAGAIKIVTRTPGDDGWLDGSVGYGNYETLKVTGSVGGPIEEGSLAGSAAFSYADRNGGIYENPFLDRDLGQYTNKAVRGKLHWYGTENFEATLSGFGVKQQNDGYNGIPYTPFDSGGGAPVPGKPLEGFYGNLSPGMPQFPNSGSTSQSGVTLDWNWQFAGMTLRSITAYTVIDDAFAFDLAGGGYLGLPGVSGLLVDSDSDLEQVSQEFHLLGSAFDDRLDWIAGVFLLNEDGAQKYDGSVPGFFGFSEVSNSDTTSYALFAEGTYSFTERLSATVGGRWTRDEKDYKIGCTGDCTPNPQTGSVVNLSETFDEFTPKFGLQYQFDETLLGYASISRGFQAGGFQTLCFGNLDCAAQVYDPQTVWNYEVGAKWDALDTLRLNAAIFYAQYEDLQQTIGRFGPNGVYFPVDNVGDVDVWGVELETTWAPADGFNLFLNLGYMNSDKVEFMDPVLGDVSRELPSNPEWSMRAGFDYTTPITPDLDLLFGLDVNYVDEYFSEVTNVLPIDSYTRFNGFFGVGQPDGRWQLVASAKNLTDSNDNVSGLYFDGDTNIRTVLPPREYMLTLRVKY